MTFSFHPEAEKEFLEAINYYEDRESGLGYDFSIEVFATIQNIVIYPTAWPAVQDEEGVRRCLVTAFRTALSTVLSRKRSSSLQ